MKKIQRELVIQQLESVLPGLSAKDVVEQSSCFVFSDKRVLTFNEEIMCSQACDIGITGAVHANAFLEILRKLVEDELDVELTENEIVIQGRRKEVRITREAEITLPVDVVEKPTKFVDLDPEFIEAIDLVQHCAAGTTNDSKFDLTCVHITPTHVEACDNAQMARVKVKTPISEKGGILVRRESIKHIVGLGMSKVSETETWIHFKNPSGLVLSCRRFVDEYHDLNKLLTFDGEKLTLPKGLGSVADRAAVFVTSSGNDEPQIKVELRPGKLRVRSTGASGSYRETKKLKYSGPELSFMIAPKLLVDITKKYNEAEITDGRLRVTMGTAQYVACLSEVTE